MSVSEVTQKNPVYLLQLSLTFMLQDGETAINMEATRFMEATEGFVQPLTKQ
jgi:hypothetical protein